MSKITLQGDVNGTGTLTIAAPNTNTNRTLNLPDAAGNLVLDSATQTLTNKSISADQVNSGTMATARLGSGTANSTTFLRGDQTWATVSLPGTGLGDVGSYAVLMMAANTNLATGGTIAGASLRYDYTASSTAGSEIPYTQLRSRNVATYDGGGTSVSGTWRKVSSGTTYKVVCGFSYWYPALYVRIS